ncbi:hypothetical protein OH76DRAFT_559404 [Lentinus brumalis]|uniref:Uncharacterized protein n=1 Tax=Lentinus brumalis TaxID=2498619 RepID=A0A371D9H7_9APHY|nr:hypothetical protein OH76DRAFT_559404 [Polyporus brumalis]
MLHARMIRIQTTRANANVGQQQAPPRYARARQDYIALRREDSHIPLPKSLHVRVLSGRPPDATTTCSSRPLPVHSRGHRDSCDTLLMYEHCSHCAPRILLICVFACLFLVARYPVHLLEHLQVLLYCHLPVKVDTGMSPLTCLTALARLPPLIICRHSPLIWRRNHTHPLFYLEILDGGAGFVIGKTALGDCRAYPIALQR